MSQEIVNNTNIIFSPSEDRAAILPTKQNPSRRNFLTMFTVAGAGLALAACNLETGKANVVPTISAQPETLTPTSVATNTNEPTSTLTDTDTQVPPTATESPTMTPSETATSTETAVKPVYELKDVEDYLKTFQIIDPNTGKIYEFQGKVTIQQGQNGCPGDLIFSFTENGQCATQTSTNTEQPSNTPTKENTQVNQPSETPHHNQPSSTPENTQVNTPQSTNTPHHEQPSQTPQPSNTEVQPSNTPQPTSTEVSPTEVLPNPPTTAPTLTPAPTYVQPTLIAPTEAPSMAPATQLPPQINSATPSI